MEMWPASGGHIDTKLLLYEGKQYIYERNMHVIITIIYRYAGNYN
jgi:hypothetical protein